MQPRVGGLEDLTNFDGAEQARRNQLAGLDVRAAEQCAGCVAKDDHVVGIGPVAAPAQACEELGRIIGGEYPQRADDDKASTADEFKTAARTYKDGFDASADPLITTLRDFGASAVNTVGQGVTDVATGVGRKIDEWRRNSARKYDEGE